MILVTASWFLMLTRRVPDLISRFTGKKEEDGYTAEKVEHIINQEADKE